MDTILENALSNPFIFISYSSDDELLVNKITKRLNDAGFLCWIDKERIRGNERFNPSITNAIELSSVFIAFLSTSYIESVYCNREFDTAVDKDKSILAVCLDEVNENTNQQSKYMFSYSVGHNIIGFGKGVDEESLDSFSNEIIDSVPLQDLKNQGEKAHPPIHTPEYIKSALRQYHFKQYSQVGNYALNEINSNLFTELKDSNINTTYNGKLNDQVALVEYLSKNNSYENKRHILIIGEGGIGKTVSLLKTCEYLLSIGINAIYIPLSKLHSEMTVDNYIDQIVCGGNQRLWRDIKALMSVEYEKTPNIVLLMDGINEVTGNYINVLVGREIKKNLIDSKKGVKLILSSRGYDYSSMHIIKKDVVLLEMQPLSQDTVSQYLKNMGIIPEEAASVLPLLRTPLMLTMFSDVERHKNKYEFIDWISLEANPNTAGKIIYNFFQTQIYRASVEENFERATHFVLIDYLLPAIAFVMIQNDSFYISEDLIWELIDSIENVCPRYNWYRKDRLRRIVRGRSQIKYDSLLDIAEFSLHFLYKTEQGYEFLHPIFRDYFSAMYIANELNAFSHDSNRIEECNPIIQQTIYSQDIINFVSDIVHEENASPIFDEKGWIFPGKRKLGESSTSLVEPLLSYWRNKEGESAQNAVANIFNIMKHGRRNLMFWCDYSYLDLRKCWLNGCLFSEWYKDQLYFSKFDGAWINRYNIVTNGHDFSITALTSGGTDYLFTGDKGGVVKIYDFQKSSWIKTFQFQTKPVIDLAYSNTKKSLAILYENVLFCYSVDEEKVIFTQGNISKSSKFRYVRFENDANIHVAYDTEPLVWRDLNDCIIDSDLRYDFPARCAKWNPMKKEIIKSHLLQLLTIAVYDENKHLWMRHPAIINSTKRTNIHRKMKGEREMTTPYLLLREAGVSKDDSVYCIQYNEDGSKVLVAVGCMLIELETDQYTVTNKKQFGNNVFCACYVNSEIALGVGSSVIIMDRFFSIVYSLNGSQLKSIVCVREDLEKNGYYIVSSQGEIKKLNRDLVVQRVRSLRSAKFIWAWDRLTKEVLMVFPPTQKYPLGNCYCYDTNIDRPLAWRHRLIETANADTSEEEYYKINSQLMVERNTKPYRKIVYKNYSGVYFYGCSFKNIQGDMGNLNNISFLIQNGGIIGDTE